LQRITALIDGEWLLRGRYTNEYTDLADGQLNQERLTQLLETNHTYLSQIIKEKSGMNLSQFINSYRIKEAVRILSDNTQQDYPLMQLCSDLGFNSLSRFYVLFKEAVGMSPSAYRKSAQSIE